MRHVFRQGSLYTGLLASVFLAFALRVYRLDYRALWWDEGLSIYFAQLDLGSLVSQTVEASDTNPPLYRLLLGLWMRVAGTSPFAARYLSVAIGCLVVVLIYVLGRRLFNARVGLIAALLAASAPVQVYYSQEAKVYPLAIFMVLLSTYFWLRIYWPPTSAAPRTRWWLWIAYVVATAAALSTHYYTVAALAVQSLWVLLLAMQAARHGARAAARRLGAWALAQGAVLLLLLPWLVVVLTGTVETVQGTGETGEVLSLLGYVRRMGLSFTAAPLAVGQGDLVAAIAVAGLALVGLALYRPFQQGGAWGTKTLLVSWIAGPLLVGYVIQLYYHYFHPRFFLYVAPGYYLLAAAGLLTVGRRLSVPLAMLGLLAFTWGPALYQQYTQPSTPAEDYRPLIDHLEALAEPGDAVLVVYLWQIGYLHSYYWETSPAVYRTAFPPDRAEAQLVDLAARHRRLWLVDYKIAPDDPNNSLGAWLNANAIRVSSTWYGNSSLSLYLAPPARLGGPAGEGGVGQQEALFGGRIRLRYDFFNARLEAGDVLFLPLSWSPLTRVGERYIIFAHVVDRHNHLWGQSDSEPAGGRSPTSAWSTGTWVEDRRALLLSPGTPPGRYEIEVGLYDPQSGHRMSVGAGEEATDRVIVGTVEVGILPGAKPKRPLPRHRLEVEFAPPSRGLWWTRWLVTYGDPGRPEERLRLIGYDLHPLGNEETERLRPGQFLHVNLYWQVPVPISGDYIVRARLVDAQERLWGEHRSQPVEGEYPTYRWQAGQFVRDQFNIALSAQAPLGRYWLEVGLSEASGGPSLVPNTPDGTLRLGPFSVVER